MIYSDLQMLLLFVISAILITPLGYLQFLSMYSNLQEAN